MTGILLRDTDIGDHAHADVRIAAGTIAEIGHRLPAMPGEETLDAAGGALLPGLCDHHLHLYAVAAAAASVQCGPPAVTGPAALAAALAAARPDEHGWIRGVGYSEKVAGLLDAAALDRLHADHPVRVQHRSGALWIVNTLGAHELDLFHAAHPGVERNPHSQPTGRLWRADEWLRQHLAKSRRPDLQQLGAQLAQLGITHLTDATPGLDCTTMSALTSAMSTGALPQHVQLLGAPIGWAPPLAPRTPTSGPYKIILSDHRLPGLDDLAEQIRTLHVSGRAIAAHCVTREALALLLAALDDTGSHPGDRIEHAALVPAELIGRLADMQLTVVTQPGFLSNRGDDYLRDLPSADHADLYRAHSLVEAGIRCALSSDAPYGPLDPWTVIAAAVHRSTPSGHIVSPAERLNPRQALTAYLGKLTDPGGPPRQTAVGAPADLVLLRTPQAEALAQPSADLVAATLIGGAVIWRRA
jgi:predicted amidohydrolase YtcJ